MLRNLAILYMENLGVVVGTKDVCQVLAVSVGNENLPETVALHQLYDSLHAFAVQAVEDIIIASAIIIEIISRFFI